MLAHDRRNKIVVCRHELANDLLSDTIELLQGRIVANDSTGWIGVTVDGGGGGSSTTLQGNYRA